MSFEEQARASAAKLRDRMETLEIPEAATVVARARRRRRVRVGALALVTAVMIAGIATVVASRADDAKVEFGGPGLGAPDLPAGAIVDGAWTLVPKESSGLGRGSSFNALASSPDTLLLAGADDQGRGTIWRSHDGLHWSETVHPVATSDLSAIALNGDTAIAIGTPEPGDAFAWWSDDAGRHWREVGRGDLFGAPVPDNRPAAFVTGVRWASGFWLAYGGSANGYEGIWISRDGANWTPRLESKTTGSIDGIVALADGRLLAYGGTVAWYSDGGVRWGEAVNLRLPDDRYLVSVAPGADVAIANQVEQHGPPTPVLRSVDEGRTWTPYRDSPDASTADPWFWTATETTSRTVIAGASGTPNRPDAWIGDDPSHLERMPASLRGDGSDLPTTSIPVIPPGGTLSLVDSVGGRIVMIGTAPELDRYYTYDAASIG